MTFIKNHVRLVTSTGIKTLQSTIRNKFNSYNPENIYQSCENELSAKMQINDWLVSCLAKKSKIKIQTITKHINQAKYNINRTCCTK